MKKQSKHSKDDTAIDALRKRAEIIESMTLDEFLDKNTGAREKYVAQMNKLTHLIKFLQNELTTVQNTLATYAPFCDQGTLEESAST